MSHLQLGRISSAAAMVGMNSAGANPLLLASAPASLASLGFRAASVSPLVVHNTIRPFLANVGRNALVGAVAFTGQHGFVSLPEGAQDVGKLVSTATEKMGLGDNQFAAGGFQLALIGGILAGIRVLGSHAIEYLKKRIVVTAEFDSRDESYSWILNWLSDHPYSKKATQFSVSTTIARGAQKINGEGGDGIVAATYFLPAPEIACFGYARYEDRNIRHPIENMLLTRLTNPAFVQMYRERVRPAGSTVATSGAAVENITISTLGRSRDLIQSLILEAQRKFIDRDQSRTVIFQADQYGAWRRTKSRPKRPLDTIVMDPKLKNYIVEDAKEFFASESWYSERGLPFRRGLLLYGSPGTGKTSFIHALAGELGLNIYVVNLSSKNLTDDTLSELVSDTPSRCLLLIEDVDAAFVQRESRSAATGITFSGLLNSVDGVSAQEGRMLCMTTNHLERLDEALIRPGRVDVRARFGKATQSQAKELFIKFYPHSTHMPDSTTKTNSNKKQLLVQDDCFLEKSGTIAGNATVPSSLKYGASLSAQQTGVLAKQFANAIPDQVFSIAQLQGFLMGYKKSPDLAVRHATEFVERAGSAEVSGTAKVGYDGEGHINEKQAEEEEKAKRQYFWEGSEQQKEREEFREERERERRASLK